jgi:hypothetical protein
LPESTVSATVSLALLAKGLVTCSVSYEFTVAALPAIDAVIRASAKYRPALNAVWPLTGYVTGLG